MLNAIAVTDQTVEQFPTWRLTPRARAMVQWIAVLLMAHVCRSAFFKRKRDPSQFDAVDHLAVFGVALIGLGAVTIMVHPSGRRALRALIQSPLVGLLIFYSFCGISALWSGTLAYSVFRSSEMLVVIALVGILFWSIKDIHLAFRVCLTISLVSALLGAAWYPLARGLALSKFHSNDFTCVASLGVVLCFGAIVERFPVKAPTKLVLSLAAFLLLLGLGTGAASIVSTIAGCIVVMVLGRSLGRITSNAVIVGALLIATSLLSLETAKAVLFPGKTHKQILTMHGRTRLWQHYYHVFRESPIVGKGFPTGEKTGSRELGVKASGHNAIVSAAVNTGCVGLFLFAGAISFIVWKGLSAVARGRPLSRTAMGVFSAGAVNMMAYPLLGSHWFWPTTTFLAALSFASFHIWNTPCPEVAAEPLA